jgi:hypothetical protein
MATGGPDKFISDMASSLDVDEKYFDVISITEGSTVFDYALQVDASSEFSLDELAKKQDDAYNSGALDLGGEI